MNLFNRIKFAAAVFDKNPEVQKLYKSGQLKFASEIDQPAKRPDVETMEAINAFMKRNPVEKAGGGMLVKPSADGSRPGYAGKAIEGFNNVFESSPGSDTYVYRRGKAENKIYKGGFKTPEAASKWGQKEFVKKFALPKKFVTAAELSEILGVGNEKGSGMASPLFERGDRPKYLLQEARRILGSYEAGKSNFFRAPTKKEIEYLKKYYKAPVITEGLAKNVKIILNSKAIMNDLTGKNKGGPKLPEFNKVVQVFKNAGVDASDAQITNALQKAAYLLRGDTFQTDVKYNVDKNTGRFIIKELEKLPFDNQYARGIYKHALNEIRLELGDTAGNLESFKRNLRKRLPDGFLQKHGLEINEIFSVRASAKNKSFPYAYFLDATDAELNKKALRSFHGALSNAQKNLNDKIADIRAGKGKYDEAVDIIKKFQITRNKFKDTIEKNYPGKNFNLANIVLGKESEVLKKNMKIPEDVYSKKLLDKWKNQGLDITGHAKKTGYVMTGADSPTVFTAQDLSQDKASRDLFIKKTIASFGSGNCAVDFGKQGQRDGGRTGYKTGTVGLDDCFRSGVDNINKGNYKTADQVNDARNLLLKSKNLLRAITKYGVLPELAFIGLESAGRTIMGDSVGDSIKKSIDTFTFGLTNFTSDINKKEFDAAGGFGDMKLNVDKYRANFDKVQALKRDIQNLEAMNVGGEFGYMGSRDNEIAFKKAALKKAEQELLSSQLPEAQMKTISRMEDNLADAKSAKSPLSKAALKDQMEGISTFGLGDYTETDSGRMYPAERKVNLDTDMFPSFKKDIDNLNKAKATGLLNIDKEILSQRLDAEGVDADRKKEFLGYVDYFNNLNNMSLSDAAAMYGDEQVYGANAVFAEAIPGYDVREQRGIGNYAGGGIAGLSGGDKSGPAPESGPQSQGLQGLMNRVKNR